MMAIKYQSNICSKAAYKVLRLQDATTQGTTAVLSAQQRIWLEGMMHRS
jgi:hypothetical protein